MEKKTKIDEINELLDKEFYVVANNYKYNYKRKVDFNKIEKSKFIVGQTFFIDGGQSIDGSIESMNFEF